MNNERASRIKDKIKTEIEARKISIYKLANDAGVSETCIRNWYSKRDYSPSITSLEKICSALNINILQLLIDEESEFYPLDKESINFIKLWNQLETKDKEAVLTLIHRLANK